jgi:hypothetical protein
MLKYARISLVLVAHAYNSSYLLRRERSGGSRFKASLGKVSETHLKKPTTKKGW